MAIRWVGLAIVIIRYLNLIIGVVAAKPLKRSTCYFFTIQKRPTHVIIALFSFSNWILSFIIIIIIKHRNQGITMTAALSEVQRLISSMWKIQT